MHPILFNIGNIPISSFGFFSVISLLAAAFIIWKFSQIYDLEGEKILDLVIITFLGGFICSRLVFAALNWHLFQEINKVFLVTRYPGFSIWGGILGGFLILKLLSSKLKIPFWQIADIAAVGICLGLAIGDLGCFLGGCNIGIQSNSFLASPVAGILGKRFPITIFESIVLLLTFFYLRKQTIRFHFTGKIAALFLILFSIIKFFTEFYRGDRYLLLNLNWLSVNHLMSFILFILGLVIFDIRSKHSIITLPKTIWGIIRSPKKQAELLLNIRKTCYNNQVNLKIKFSKTVSALKEAPDKLKRKINVKPTPKNLR